MAAAVATGRPPPLAMNILRPAACAPSPCRGVSYNKRDGRWQVHDEKGVYLGNFSVMQEAIACIDAHTMQAKEARKAVEAAAAEARKAVEAAVEAAAAAVVKVGWCRLTPSNPLSKRSFSYLLSILNLRRYTEADLRCYTVEENVRVWAAAAEPDTDAATMAAYDLRPFWEPGLAPAPAPMPPPVVDRRVKVEDITSGEDTDEASSPPPSSPPPSSSVMHAAVDPRGPQAAAVAHAARGKADAAHANADAAHANAVALGVKAEVAVEAARVKVIRDMEVKEARRSQAAAATAAAVAQPVTAKAVKAEPVTAGAAIPADDFALALAPAPTPAQPVTAEAVKAEPVTAPPPPAQPVVQPAARSAPLGHGMGFNDADREFAAKAEAKADLERQRFRERQQFRELVDRGVKVEDSEDDTDWDDAADAPLGVATLALSVATAE